MITCMEATAIDSNLAILEPGDPGWDSARRAFDLAVDQRPAAIAVPTDEDGVVSAVCEARRRGLRVVPQCGGRGAARVGPLGDALLLRTAGLAGVEIDARAHRARIKAGARWADLDQASFLGLAPAAGFDRGAGVVGTVLGDGMGWLARRHGLAAAGVTAVELVTPDGERTRTNGDELLEGVRDGGVITTLELALHPADDLYAGALFFPFERAAEVLHAWREWTETAPREITSIGRLIQFGNDVADLVRNRSFVLIEAAHLGRDEEGAELLRPLRDLRPELDTFTIVPPSALGHLHMEPQDPVARLADDGLVGALPPAAIDDLVAVAGPGSGSPLASVELRHASGALETLERGFFTHACGMPVDAASAAAIEAQLALVAGALAPYGAFPAHLGG